MDFEGYVREHGDQLLRLACTLSDNTATAEDVVQEVLLRAHGRWERIARLDYPHAYVRRMVANEATSWRRRWSRIEPRPDDQLDGPAPSGQAVDDDLARAVASLPAKQRIAVALRYFEDLSYRDIGAVLGCRPTTARGYVHRALRTLRVSVSTNPDPLLSSVTGRDLS